MINVFVAWSGGKDSALALYRILQQPQYCVKYLLTTVNEAHQRISMHGVRVALLQQQAQAIGIPLKIVWVPENPSMMVYESRMTEALLAMKEANITTGIFGDIYLQDLREYRETKLAIVGLKAVFPLWGENTKELVHEFIAAGLQAKLVCVSEQRVGRAFLGRKLNKYLLEDLPQTVDPAGENGEYHTFVYAGPLFKYPVKFTYGESIMRNYAAAAPAKTDCNTNYTPAYDAKFWFCDLLPVPDSAIYPVASSAKVIEN